MPAVDVQCLFETHLTVTDLDRSIAFYSDVVGLDLAHRIPARHTAFFWIGGRGRSMLGLWSIHASPLRLRLHLAFAVTLDDLHASIARLCAAGVTPRDGDGQPINEPVVIGWMPAASVYFDDPDGHSLEYVAMLPDKPDPAVGFMGWSEWQARLARTSN